MDLNKLTMKSQAALAEAQQQASARNHQLIEPEHVLFALLADPEGVVFPLLHHVGANPASSASASAKRSRSPRRCSRRARSRRGLAQPPRACSRRPGPRPRRSPTSTSRPSTCCSRCWPAATTPRRGSCRRPGISRDAMLAALAQVRGSQRVTSENPEETFQSLEKYGRDLTATARGGQARPGDRPRRGDPPLDPGPVPPHEEQPGADRRAGRRQDRDRRGARAADRRRRRADLAEGQAADRARPRRDARRREVPRRVRGAAEGRAQGDRRQRGRDHHVHRRAPHDRRRGRGRGRDGRRQHAQADARARRAPRDRRDHAGRVPPAHREGPGARTAVPAGARRGAERRGHDRDPARAEGALRGAPRRADPRPRARRRRGAVATATSPAGSCPTRPST